MTLIAQVVKISPPIGFTMTNDEKDCLSFSCYRAATPVNFMALNVLSRERERLKSPLGDP